MVFSLFTINELKIKTDRVVQSSYKYHKNRDEQNTLIQK